MFNAIKEFIFGKPAQSPVNPQITDAVTQAPYKVPEPAATTTIPLVVQAELPLVQLEQVSAPVADTADIAIAQLPDPVAVPAKAPRKPRTPKAIVETAVVKKAAPVKKAAAIKAAPKSKKV
jgi:hypothetical protein